MEYTAFHQEYHRLHTGIRNGVESLAIEAWSKDLVCEQVKNKATSTTTDKDERAKAFLDEVGDRIKTDWRAFDKFVGLLREQAAYEHLAKNLESRKRELDSLPKAVTESQRDDQYDARRAMPDRHDSPFLNSGRNANFQPFPSHHRGSTSTSGGPRPIPEQKTDPHPLGLDPSSVGRVRSFSWNSTDSEESPSEFSEFSGSQVAVLTTAPTPVSEEQERGIAKAVSQSQSHNGEKLTVSIPQRSDSTESNEYVTPPSSPQPSPIQESSTEGTSTAALAGGDYSQPKTYHHRRRIAELEETLSKKTMLLHQRERELRVAEDTTIRLRQKDKENRKSLREMQSMLEKMEREYGAWQYSAYMTNEVQQSQITELKHQLELFNVKADAYDRIRKSEALEERVEELQMRFDRMEAQHYDYTCNH